MLKTYRHPLLNILLLSSSSSSVSAKRKRSGTRRIPHLRTKHGHTLTNLRVITSLPSESLRGSLTVIPARPRGSQVPQMKLEPSVVRQQIQGSSHTIWCVCSLKLFTRFSSDELSPMLYSSTRRTIVEKTSSQTRRAKRKLRMWRPAGNQAVGRENGSREQRWFVLGISPASKDNIDPTNKPTPVQSHSTI